jgi:4a-hydroxytetrahydrobiopterin dehydratase
MIDLVHKKCVPCEGGIDPLTSEEAATYLAVLEGWEMREVEEISKGYVFKDFTEALRFINEVGAIAEAEGHHPDILLYSFNKVRLTNYTHAIGGLHLNDFVLASKIDAMKKEKFPA